MKAQKGRCGSCRFWKGDRKKFLNQLNSMELENLKSFWDPREGPSWTYLGDCRELRIEMDIRVNAYRGELDLPGTFGCNLYKKEEKETDNG